MNFQRWTIGCAFASALANAPAWSAQVALERVVDQGAVIAPSSAASARAAVQSAGPDGVTLNFVNADIEGVVKAVSEITGRNFVLDPRVKGTVNIVSARPLDRAAVYEVFLSALRLQGFAAIERRGSTQIIPEADAKLYSSPTFGPKDRPTNAGDRLQTQVFVLKYQSATQIVPLLRPLIAPNNAITAERSSNALVITDYASNLQRIAKIIDALDQPNRSEEALIPLQYASALDVAQTVNRLFAETAQAEGAAGGDGAQRLIVVADARSNSLLARSENPSRIAKLRSVVALLDTPTSVGGNMHVIYLRNADAMRMAETLRAVYGGESPGTAGRSGLRMATTLGGAGPSPLAATQPPIPGMPSSPAVAALSATASPFGPPAQSTTSSGVIQADAATNSVIITAPDAIYNNLRAVVEKLDVRRAQVYVEALIAEVTADRAAEFGIQWQSFSGAGAGATATRGFGGTNFGAPGQNILGIAQNPLSAGRGLNIGVIRGRVSIPGVGEILDLGLLVRALESDTNANILSTPTLLTLDNEEARIVIGQNVPFITGQYALSGAATTPTPFQTIERRDVGLTLRIKPQVTQGGTVRLEIYQEVSSIGDLTNPAGVITNKRAVESMVLVDDGQIVVIGGLIQDSVRNSTEKVPLLGDIPWLGGLFHYRSRSRSKTNLMVFLRPTLLRDSGAADGLANDRYDYILGQQRLSNPAPSAPLPNLPQPELPPRAAPQTGTQVKPLPPAQ
jgi:general secretion pathway protein D